jgi:PIN domain nuclease of toxin-antitoxin system
MLPRFLLDTHIVVRWLSDPKRLTREQTRVLERAAHQSSHVGVSAITLLEVAALFAGGRIQGSMAALFDRLQSDPIFVLLPITIDIATEVATMGGPLSDPADRAILATARVHRLRLITSNERIVASHLVAMVE